MLTGEDWNAVMYDGMAASGSWSALYFVALLVIGNFLVLNLFVAILLSNIEQASSSASVSLDARSEASEGGYPMSSLGGGWWSAGQRVQE